MTDLAAKKPEFSEEFLETKEIKYERETKL